MKKILILKNKNLPEDNDKISVFNSFSPSARYEYGTYDNLEIFFPGTGEGNAYIHLDGVDILDYDLVYFRSWKRAQPIATAVANFLNFNSIPFVDESVGIPLHGNKILQMMLLQLNNLPIPKTLFFGKSQLPNSWNKLSEMIGSPMIAKSVSASKGMDNYLIENSEDFQDILGRIMSSTSNFIFQEYIENKFDYRILVLGEEVAVAEKRIRQDESTHLNNVAHGAIEEFISVDEVKELHDISIESAKVFRRQIAGVDIIVSKNGEPYILEVNPSPGFSYDKSISPEIPELSKYLLSITR